MAGKTLSRRQSRRKAFELLFELEQHPLENPCTILERTFTDKQVTEMYLSDEDSEGFVSGVYSDSCMLFIRELVEAATTHRDSLDEELMKYPHDWSFERIGVPERILLRLAVAEMVFLGTSYKVVINEALDLTKMYAQDEASKFINGILGAIVNDLEGIRKRCGIGYLEES